MKCIQCVYVSHAFPYVRTPTYLWRHQVQPCSKDLSYFLKSVLKALNFCCVLEDMLSYWDTSFAVLSHELSITTVTNSTNMNKSRTPHI